MATDWLVVDDVKYYLHPTNGAMQIGWKEIDDEWYYFHSSGEMARGDVTIDGVLHKFNPWGAWEGRTSTVRNGWRCEWGNLQYYRNGVVQTGWQRLDNEWYYVDAWSGTIATGGIWWIDYNGYYFHPSGGEMQTGWQSVWGVWHYFLPSGAMARGDYFIDGAWHRFSLDGEWEGRVSEPRNGWQRVHMGYFEEWEWIFWNYYRNGVLQTGWQLIDGKWYYFHSGWGEMAQGFGFTDGNWYSFHPESGVWQTGWQQPLDWHYYQPTSGVEMRGWQLIGGSWYFLHPIWGQMVTGWLKQDSTWYYLQPSGVMATGVVNIDGVQHEFSSSGVWLKQL